uniref:Uncharacterized protein n=1 Tax=Oryza sativa subsp. japonica TaxID=39947 RepID=Q656J5_ORYSJ|nr:hypothetical protein [Oryza sativa Japonica Group]
MVPPWQPNGSIMRYHGNEEKLWRRVVAVIILREGAVGAVVLRASGHLYHPCMKSRKEEDKEITNGLTGLTTEGEATTADADKDSRCYPCPRAWPRVLARMATTIGMC